jgi:hypothetical protein
VKWQQILFGVYDDYSTPSFSPLCYSGCERINMVVHPSFFRYNCSKYDTALRAASRLTLEQSPCLINAFMFP